MTTVRFRPLEKWSEKTKLTYKRSPFGSVYAKTLNLLERELAKIYATDVVIEAGFTEQDIRNDGWPRSGARPRHPGVILYFRTPNGAMRFPCGTYGNFENNVRAIALTLEALRTIDRYGVTMGHEQYTGFKQIAGPGTDKTRELLDAAEVISLYTGRCLTPFDVANDEESFHDAYRIAAKNCHPDVVHSNEKWLVLQSAKSVMDEHFAHRRAAH